jgi:prepilin-type N-terminal cleavage/methylation domain-containing protein
MPPPRDAAGAGSGIARTRGTAGFTLIELAIVVVLIGILASTAVPNFLKLVYKSKRAEAMAVLEAVHTAQSSYHADYAIFANSFDELGFLIEGGEQIDSQTIASSHYTYTMTALELNGDSRANFRATAVGDIDPSDPVLDILIIENQLTVVE